MPFSEGQANLPDFICLQQHHAVTDRQSDCAAPGGIQIHRPESFRSPDQCEERLNRRRSCLISVQRNHKLRSRDDSAGQTQRPRSRLNIVSIGPRFLIWRKTQLLPSFAEVICKYRV